MGDQNIVAFAIPNRWQSCALTLALDISLLRHPSASSSRSIRRAQGRRNGPGVGAFVADRRDIQASFGLPVIRLRLAASPIGTG
jgi:hypothetical protein